MKKEDIQALELIKTALEDGHTSWAFEGRKLIGYGAEREGLICTEYEVDTDDRFETIFAHDVWDDGYIKTGWAQLGHSIEGS